MNTENCVRLCHSHISAKTKVELSSKAAITTQILFNELVFWGEGWGSYANEWICCAEIKSNITYVPTMYSIIV